MSIFGSAMGSNPIDTLGTKLSKGAETANAFHALCSESGRIGLFLRLFLQIFIRQMLITSKTTGFVKSARNGRTRIG